MITHTIIIKVSYRWWLTCLNEKHILIKYEFNLQNIFYILIARVNYDGIEFIFSQLDR